MKKYLELITAKRAILVTSIILSLTLIFTIAIQSQANSQVVKQASNNTSNKILAAQVVHAAGAEISEDTTEKPTIDETLADNYARSYDYYKELYGPKEQPKKVVVVDGYHPFWGRCDVAEIMLKKFQEEPANANKVDWLSIPYEQIADIVPKEKNEEGQIVEVGSKPKYFIFVKGEFFSAIKHIIFNLIII